MILTSGWCKGMTVKAPKGSVTRPTSAKTREMIINMLQMHIPGSVFIDLFSGTGAVGLSALSRGATGAIFVENDKRAFSALQLNLKEASRRAANQNIKVDPFRAIHRDVSSVWADLSRAGNVDIIWADPPYAMAVAWLQSAQSDIQRLLKRGGVFAVESGVEDLADIESCMGGWDLLKSKKIGRTSLTVWTC